MKRLAFTLAFAAAACTPAAPPAPHIERLASPASTQGGSLCTADGAWCAAKSADGDSYSISFRNRAMSTLPLSDGQDVWASIIRFPRADGGEDVLVGISNTDQTAYSGGGGQATQVTLYPLSSSTSAATPPAPALTFPESAALDIRACFSPEDQAARRDACSDQYNFTGTLSLDTTATPARLVLTTVATTYPGHLSRSEDNTHALSADDLKTVRDETCSYRRVFSRGADGAYRPDQPLPACEDYLQP